VGVLDVLFDPCTEVDEGLLVCSAPAPGVGRGPNAGYNLAWLFKDCVSLEIVEVPARGAGLLGKLGLLPVEGGEGITEEQSYDTLLWSFAPAEGGAWQVREVSPQLRVGLKQRLVLEVHVLDCGLGALVG